MNLFSQDFYPEINLGEKNILVWVDFWFRNFASEFPEVQTRDLSETRKTDMPLHPWCVIRNVNNMKSKND